MFLTYIIFVIIGILFLIAFRKLIFDTNLNVIKFSFLMFIPGLNVVIFLAILISLSIDLFTTNAIMTHNKNIQNKINRMRDWLNKPIDKYD